MSSRLRFAALAIACILTACGKQAEGERCDLNSGSLDCETGLVCRSAEQLSIDAEPGWALCCPPDDVQPSVNACRAGASLPDEVEQPNPPASGPDASVPVGDGGT